MHSNKEYTEIKAISNSSLNLLEQSPKKFLKFYNLEFEESDKKYFLIGSAIHCYILEYNEFFKRYKFLDYTAPNSANKKLFLDLYISSKGDKNERLINAYKKSYSTYAAKDETVLEKAKELLKELSSYLKYLKYKDKGIDIIPGYLKTYLEKLKKELTNNTTANNLLFSVPTEINDIDIFNELPIIWEQTIENTPYTLKALLDRVILDHDKKLIQLIDLKTTVDIKEFKTSSFFKYHYDRQLSFYSLAIMNYFKQEYPDLNIEDYTIEHYIVAVNKEMEPETAVFKITNSTILNASKQVSNLLNIAHWHLSNNKWEYSKEHYENGYETI